MKFIQEKISNNYFSMLHNKLMSYLIGIMEMNQKYKMRVFNFLKKNKSNLNFLFIRDMP